MAIAFGRTYTLIVDSLKIPGGLRITFDVQKTLTKEPNTANIKVFNLNELTRQSMKKKGAKVILTAGYTSNAAVIFSGDARTIDHFAEGDTNWISHIQCGDGEQSYQFSRFNETFRPGTSIADVAIACAETLGINLGNLPDEMKKGDFRGALTQYKRGYTGHGSSIRQLEEILKSIGLTLSIQDGALQVLRGGAPAPSRAILLTPETGLIGSPELGTPDKKGAASVLKFKSLLQPGIRCGGRVEIRSKSVSGQFRIEKVTHAGDSTGQEWYSLGEAKPS